MTYRCIEMTGATNILVVDDDPVFARTLARSLRRRGFAADWVSDFDAALERMAVQPPNGVVLDLNLGGRSSLPLIGAFLAANPVARILVLTGYACIESAVSAIKLGATQYLAKPAHADEVISALGLSPANEVAKTDGKHRVRVRTLEKIELDHIRRNLRAHGGNVSATARALKMNLRTLQRKLARYRQTSKDPLGGMDIRGNVRKRGARDGLT